MLPDIPTAAEAGVPGLELVSWYAVYAPASTPQPVVDRLADALEKVATSESYRQQVNEQVPMAPSWVRPSSMRSSGPSSPTGGR